MSRIRLLDKSIYELIAAGMLIEVSGDEKGEESRFVPSEDLSNMTLGTMVDRLEARGQWKIDLDISNQLAEKWLQAISVRSKYLNDLRDIRLQDL